MKTISQREFRNHSAAVMDAVEAGGTYHITRNGVEVAELRPGAGSQQGAAMAKNAADRAVRMEELGAALADFDPLPFDGDAAARFGTLVALVVAAGRSPRPRRVDLMIAAIASVRGLPLCTRHPEDFAGLQGAVTVVAVQATALTRRRGAAKGGRGGGRVRPGGRTGRAPRPVRGRPR